MKQSTITILENNSAGVDFANLIVSVRQTLGTECEVVVGYPGLPSVVKDLLTGDAVLFETPIDGVLEVRVMSQSSNRAEFLVSQVSPRPGFAGALVSDDPNNSPFSSNELEQIAESIKKLKIELDQSELFLAEQLDLVTRKLDEIQAASQRLGRKDWIHYVGGALTSLCITAAFTPEARNGLFESVNAAFEWLFSNALNLLS